MVCYSTKRYRIYTSNGLKIEYSEQKTAHDSIFLDSVFMTLFSQLALHKRDKNTKKCFGQYFPSRVNYINRNMRNRHYLLCILHRVYHRKKIVENPNSREYMKLSISKAANKECKTNSEKFFLYSLFMHVYFLTYTKTQNFDQSYFPAYRLNLIICWPNKFLYCSLFFTALLTEKYRITTLLTISAFNY